MAAQFVKVVYDIKCNRPEASPIYRVFVADELITERRWRWLDPDIYLEEMLQLQVEPGRYLIKFEVVDGEPSDLEFTNGRVTQGPAKIKNNQLLKVGE
jgi:hypothetical protein